MVKEHVDSAEWHPLSRPPPRSGVFGVRKKSSATPYFSAFIAQALRWSQPQSQLRAFDATPGEQPAYDMHDYVEWRELTDAELAALSPTFQAWAARFLQTGGVVMPDSE